MLPPRPREAAGGAAMQFGKKLARLEAFGERVTVATMGAEDRVVITQCAHTPTAMAS
jgi:hypothetical protein